MGASAMTAKPKTMKEKVQEEQAKSKKNFMTIHMKGDKKLVYVDLKSKKIIPMLLPLKENILYAKRKL